MQRFIGPIVLVVLATAAFAGDETGSLPVEDLVTRKGPSARPMAAVSPHPFLPDQSGRALTGEDGLLASARDYGAPPWFDGDTLCGAIDAMLGPDAPSTSYDDKTKSIVFAAELRSGVARGLADLRARMPQPIRVKVSVDRMTGREGVLGPERLLFAEGSADPARTLELSDARERRVAIDYDVELAQAASIGDPILSFLRTGVSAALCVTPMPDGRAAVVETVVRVARDEGGEPIDLGHPGFGALDRCEVAFDELGACLRVENGRPATVSWIGRNGATLVLRIEAAWTPPPPPGDPAIMVSALFRSGFWGFMNLSSPDEPEDEAEDRGRGGKLSQRTVSAEELVARAFPDPLYAALVKWNGSVMTLPSLAPRTAPEQFAAICAESDALLRGVRVECIAVNVPAGTAVSIDGPLPAGAWAVASYSGPAILGLPFCSAGGTERRFVRDWDVEVAQSSRIPDPLVAQLATGHYLNLAAHRTHVDVDLDLRRLGGLTRRTMALAVGRSSQGQIGDKTTGPATDPMLPPETVAVELPTVAELRVAAAIPLGADGTGTLRRSGAALLGEGRELVVLVRVR